SAGAAFGRAKMSRPPTCIGVSTDSRTSQLRSMGGMRLDTVLPFAARRSDIARAQLALEDLACARDGVFRDNVEAAWTLVAGDLIAAMGAHLLDGQVRTGSEADHGVDPLAPVGIGDADDGDLGDRGM